MNISTLGPSLIRTYVPIVVGGLISWLLSLGITLDEQVESGLIVAITGLLIAVYYTLVRLLEKKWPGLSILLGSNQMPAVYAPEGEKDVAVITALPAPSEAPGEPGAPGSTNRPF